MGIFPVIPSPLFFLLAIIDFLFIAVGIDFVGFALFLFPFSTFLHVLHLEVSHFAQRHCGLVGILLPHLCHQIHFLSSQIGGWAHTWMNLLRTLLHFPHFHFGHWLLLFGLMQFLLLRILLQSFFVQENLPFLIDVLQLSHCIVHFQSDEILHTLSLVAFIVHLLTVLVTIFNEFLLFVIGDDHLSGIVEILLFFDALPRFQNLSQSKCTFSGKITSSSQLNSSMSPRNASE